MLIFRTIIHNSKEVEVAEMSTHGRAHPNNAAGTHSELYSAFQWTDENSDACII